ncbi:MAG: glmZ(sRNA)-inactivating NTPase [Thermotoga sp.]|nr:glmZ(sRNA)-inactivating NTPase [Thermotoga sp.]
MKRIVVVSGLSGAGKTTAMGFLEDLGYFCVDNVPGNILEELLKLFMSSDLEKMAMAIDVRSEHLGDPISHPLQKDGIGLEDAIEKERKILSRIKEIADVVIDTTSMNTHQLRETLTHFLVNQSGGTSVRIMSFGFKHGIPMDADFVFDARFLPNPHYVPELSSKTGLDSKVEAYFKNYPVVEEFIEKIYEVLKVAIEEYQRTGRRIITVGIGCTGGKHRSVYIAHRLKEMLEKEGFTVIEKHRDIEKV